MEINSQTHEVVKYFVQSGWGVKKIVGDVPELIVAPSQVVELTRERMIVKDAVTPEEESALKEVKASVASTVRSATLAQTREEPAKAAE